MPIVNGSFVTFFDVLGFKELVEKNSHKDLIELYEYAFYGTLETFEKFYRPVYEATIPKAEHTAIDIQTFVISDSIILIQNDLTEWGLSVLIAKSQVILSALMADGIPLRGGIAHGPVTIIQNRHGTTVVGKALVNAHKIENKQVWSGCIIDRTCFDVVPPLQKEPLASRLIKSKPVPLLCEYDVPIKTTNGIEYQREFVLDWTNYQLLKSSDDVRAAFEKHGKSMNSDYVQSIIDNSVEFYVSRS